MAIYSDVNYLNMKKGAKIEDINAVYQAVYTLLNTKVGDRVFRPTYGSFLSNYLFEPCDESTALKIRYELLETLKQEPRIIMNNSKTTVTPIPEKHKFAISVVFSILGFSDTEKSLDLELKVR